MKTIKDVAKLAGVSPATVSRVINNTTQVNTDTRIKIEQAIKELNFIPNASARALVNKSTKTIGVVISHLSSPFFAAMAKSIEVTAKKLGYKVLISTGSLDADKELQAIQSLQAQRCDAFIVNSKELADETLINLANTLPGFVLINKYIEQIAERCVSFDNVSGGYLMAERLAMLGHQDIVVLSSDAKVHDASLRLKGIRQALEKYQITLRLEQVEYGSPDYYGGEKAIQALIDKEIKFTGILCYNDSMATGVIAKLTDLGVQIPDDVSIIGFDDIFLAEHCVPKLTTIKYPIEIMAARATHLALQLLDNNDTELLKKTYRYLPYLVKRDSEIKR